MIDCSNDLLAWPGFIRLLSPQRTSVILIHNTDDFVVEIAHVWNEPIEICRWSKLYFHSAKPDTDSSRGFSNTEYINIVDDCPRILGSSFSLICSFERYWHGTLFPSGLVSRLAFVCASQQGCTVTDVQSSSMLWKCHYVSRVVSYMKRLGTRYGSDVVSIERCTHFVFKPSIHNTKAKKIVFRSSP